MTKKAHRGTHEFPWEEEIEEISYVKGARGGGEEVAWEHWDKVGRLWE